MEEELTRLFLEHIGVTATSYPEYDKLLRSITNAFRERCGKPIYPNPGESLALSVMTPKTAALTFDKVYRIPILDESVPEELGFYCATKAEIAVVAMSLFVTAAQEAGIELNQDKGNQEVSAEKKSPAENEVQSLRLLCSQFQKEFQIAPTIFFNERGSCRNEFPIGKHQILTAAIPNIAMVDESSLTWEQVIEFRRDIDTRKKYRRLVRWVNTELKETAPEEIEDLIAIRLDDYQWALKKHGIKVSLGALSCLLDPKFLGVVSATVAATAVAGGGVWAALAGASLTVGQAAITFGTALIDGLDARRKDNYEVAYIHEIQKRLG